MENLKEVLSKASDVVKDYNMKHKEFVKHLNELKKQYDKAVNDILTRDYDRIERVLIEMFGEVSEIFPKEDGFLLKFNWDRSTMPHTLWKVAKEINIELGEKIVKVQDGWYDIEWSEDDEEELDRFYGYYPSIYVRITKSYLKKKHNIDSWYHVTKKIKEYKLEEYLK